jgi:hypothetical protein
MVIRLRAGRSGVRFSAGARDFPLQQNVQICCGADAASYSMSARVLSRPGREVRNSPPSSAEVRNGWSYSSTIFLHGVDRDKFTFYFLPVYTFHNPEDSNFY